MQIAPAILAAAAVTLIGTGILWGNPRRVVNRAVFFCSLHVAGWLALLHVTLSVSAAEGLFWLRCSAALGAFLPLHLWSVKEMIAGESAKSERRRWAIGMVWVCCTLMLAVLPATDFFIPAHSRSDARLFGKGYYLYMVGVVALYVAVCSGTFRDSRRLTGIRRLELQVWLFGGSSAALAVVMLMAANAVFHEPALIRLQPFVVLVFFGGTIATISVHRVFDARQVALVGLQKSMLVGCVAGCAFVLDWLLSATLSEPFAFLSTTAATLWFAAWLNERIDRTFHSYPQAVAARQAAFDAARHAQGIEELESAFLGVIKGWGQSDHALVLSGPINSLRGGEIDLADDNIVPQAMRQMRWATPERLARERSTPERAAVEKFLREQNLGILVIGEGPTLTALIGVGVAASRRPFTYPQVEQLMELASIMESALERAHFALKVQHTEQLATVGLLGASLAHEIRNPLVTIKTFVQLLPTHHQDPGFREKFFRLIGDEVNRIDRLTEQLLDLASPRAYAATTTELHPVLRASLDLVAAKAKDKDIAFLTEFAAVPDRVHTDGSAAKQVMLNLCFNAIQAVEGEPGPRWVKIATRNVGDGVEMAVSDSGPGIAPEMRSRLFQPFQTTKTSGFGLGLAICSDILGNLNATISVDPAGTGIGATFRVNFPCRPPSS
ncbi:MAG: hypothetical protein RLZZ15_1955 [Verrucomicrobiota bacterium]|jgi:signal transduction histidine kinase